ncbi:MAG: glycosyltransferase [bacterium]|nr:glycosyltransferase [bacterium]
MAKLTVLMTVYNGEAYLRETVESILAQTYKDFIFLILDNASSDGSRDIINSYDDKRIELVPLPENIGQVAALRKGLGMVKTELAARMDADDISLPERFERQVSFLESRPEVGICGTFAHTFGVKRVKWSYPCRPEEIKVKLLFECSLVHPSVMMRKDLLDKFQLNYDDTLSHSYDWDLWQRASHCFDIANIPGYLLEYRLHEQSESQRTVDLQAETAGRLDDVSLERLGLQNHPLRGVHRDVATETANIKNREADFFDRVKEWFDVLEEANRVHDVYDEQALHRFLKQRFFIVLTKNGGHGRSAFSYFKSQHIRRYVPLSWSLKFLVKLIIKKKK